MNDKSFSAYASLLVKYSQNVTELQLKMVALLTSRAHSFETTTRHSLDNVLIHISVSLKMSYSTSACSVVFLTSEKDALL